MPYTAIVDVTNLCNLHCPGCPTGLGLHGRQGAYITQAHLRHFLDQVADYLLIANLFNWGESLLHPEITDIVSLVHDRGIFTSISSNLNIRDQRKLEDLCDAGLDHLVVSADGATKASYEKYRRGGDFELMLDNFRFLAAYKKRKRKMTPIIEWQLLAFRHLEKEIPDAYQLSKEVGADWFAIRGAVAPQQLQPSDTSLQGAFYDGKSRCDFLWSNITLQSDGGIAPCCMTYDARDDFGHVERATIREMRNGNRFTAARKLFKPLSGPAPDIALDHPCLRCPITHRQSHLRPFLMAHQELFTDNGFQSILAHADDLVIVSTKFDLS